MDVKRMDVEAGICSLERLRDMDLGTVYSQIICMEVIALDYIYWSLIYKCAVSSGREAITSRAYDKNMKMVTQRNN